MVVFLIVFQTINHWKSFNRMNHIYRYLDNRILVLRIVHVIQILIAQNQVPWQKTIIPQIIIIFLDILLKDNNFLSVVKANAFIFVVFSFFPLSSFFNFKVRFYFFLVFWWEICVWFEIIVIHSKIIFKISWVILITHYHCVRFCLVRNDLKAFVVNYCVLSHFTLVAWVLHLNQLIALLQFIMWQQITLIFR